MKENQLNFSWKDFYRGDIGFVASQELLDKIKAAIPKALLQKYGEDFDHADELVCSEAALTWADRIFAKGSEWTDPLKEDMKLILDTYPGRMSQIPDVDIRFHPSRVEIVLGRYALSVTGCTDLERLLEIACRKLRPINPYSEYLSNKMEEDLKRILRERFLSEEPSLSP